MRIVCFHQNQIGDLLFSLPALHNLRVGYPHAHITSVVRPNCAPLLGLSGLVDRIIERPSGPIDANLRVAAQLRQDPPDLGLLFSTSFSSSMIALLARCTATAGFRRSPLSGMFTYRTEWRRPPSTEYNLRLLDMIGCPIEKRDYVGLIKARDEERIEAGRLLESAGISPDDRYAVLGPGTSSRREIKCWSNEGFAGVADGIYRDLGLRSIIVGLNGGEAICSVSKYAVDLTGKTSTSVLAVVLERASLFAGIDSGVMHLAAAMGVPVTALFGPSDPEITGPQGTGHKVVRSETQCAPCLKSHCKNPVCMEGIGVEDVLDAICQRA